MLTFIINTKVYALVFVLFFCNFAVKCIDLLIVFKYHSFSISNILWCIDFFFYSTEYGFTLKEGADADINYYEFYSNGK